MGDCVEAIVLEADEGCRIVGRRVENCQAGAVHASARLQQNDDDPDGRHWVYTTIASCAAGEGLILIRSDDGRLRGALSYGTEPDGDGLLEVVRLGVNRKRRGLGTVLMREAARIAARRNIGLCAYSRPGSEAFFRALAMRQKGRQEIRKFTDNYYFSFSPEEARNFSGM